MSLASTHDGSKLVEKFYKTAVDGDLDGAFAMMRPNFVATIPGCLPWGGVHKSADDFKSVVLAKLAGLLDVHTVKLLKVYGEGDSVFALLTAKTGAGEPVTMAEDWIVRDGKLESVHVFYFDPFPVINLAKQRQSVSAS